MTGLDCNILIQLAMQDHVSHSATFRAVESEVLNGNRLALVSLVVTEFLHVVTDPRRFSPPLTMSDALGWIEEFRRNVPVDIIEPTPTCLDQSLRWMREFKLGRKRVLDTHLAAVLYTQGITRLLTSNPADFTIFRVIETVTP